MATDVILAVCSVVVLFALHRAMCRAVYRRTHTPHTPDVGTRYEDDLPPLTPLSDYARKQGEHVVNRGAW